MAEGAASRGAAAVSRETRHTLADEIAISRLYPQLWLHVQAKSDGVHLTATIIPEDGPTRLSNKVILRAVWQPSEVTEQLIVEWAYRALRKSLQDHYDGTGHL